MDDKTLESLLAAFKATPDNKHLLPVLMDAFWNRGEARRGFQILKDQSADDWPEDADVKTAVRIILEAGEGYQALAYLKRDSDEDAEAHFLRAQAYMLLNDIKNAKQSYDCALDINPLIEDADFTQQLKTAILQGENAGSQTPDPKSEAPRGIPVEEHPDLTENNLDRIIQPSQETITFQDVGGLDNVKKEIRRRIITPFLKPSLFKRFRKKIGGGILLFGPPGCGKTMLARATAGECNASFFNVAISDILSMWIGESEGRLSALFERARSQTPSVVFFDEIEALGGKRQYTHSSAAANVVSEFLAQMDGFTNNNQGVLILAATNVPWAVDPAFRRPGRFDRVLFVPPPDRAAREVILQIHLMDRPGGDKINVRWLAERTSGFSGADLAHLVENSVDIAIEQSLETGSETPLSDAIMREGLQETKNTTVEWLTTARNYARYSNEAGQYDEVLDFLRKHGK